MVVHISISRSEKKNHLKPRTVTFNRINNITQVRPIISHYFKRPGNPQFKKEVYFQEVCFLLSLVEFVCKLEQHYCAILYTLYCIITLNCCAFNLNHFVFNLNFVKIGSNLNSSAFLTTGMCCSIKYFSF